MKPLWIPSYIYSVVAALAFALPWLFMRTPPRDHQAYCVSLGLSAVWAVGVVLAFARAEKRAPRLLLGLPLVLFWPAIGVYVELSCRSGGRCL